MPAGYDAEVAELFRDLRVASNLTETDLAQRIATPIEVVQALEQGAIYALPPWPETCRVVNAYGTLLNLDTRPLLRRIYAQLEAGIVELRPKTMPDVPVMAPQGDGLGSKPSQAPQPPPMPEAPVWPNGQGGARPQSPQPQSAQPQAPRPQAAQPQAASQATRAPQPQAPRPQAPQPPQAPQWPGGAQAFPQSRPNAAPAYAPQAPQAPQQAPSWSDGPQAPQAQPQQPYPGEPQSYEPQPSYPPEPSYEPEPVPATFEEDASFPGEVEAEEAAEAEPQQKRPALLKWGIGALVAAVVLVGLWMALGDSSTDPGSSSGFNTSDPVLDPDDPRSRKADRLPNNF